jgi:uncharacterized protein YllA (UPF0747 family)
MLVLRYSFLLIEQKWNEKIKHTGLRTEDLFRPEEELVNELVKQRSQHQLSLEKEIAEAHQYYEKLSKIGSTIDPTLVQHIEALEAKALRPLEELEKKLLKAEKRKFKDQQRQIHLIKSALFPLNNLQERVDNFLPWYAERGKKFIADIYDNSLTLEQKFVVLSEK